MCGAAVASMAMSYVIDGSMKQMQQTIFVEAGADFTFEEDDIYNSYVKSAILQRDLARQQNKDKKQTWGYEHYKKF